MWIFRSIISTLIFLWVFAVGTDFDGVESFVLQQNRQRNRQRYEFNGGIRRQIKHGSARATFVSTRLFCLDPTDTSIRFLGKGSNAIVRPGVVLLAPAEEFHHFLRESAVFIYDMGTDANDDYIIRGVILDNPTPFTIGEMMDNKENGGVYDNLIFRGGESGGQEAFCLHSVDTLGLEEIGTSSIYQGGELDKIEDPSKVKFFFNYMEFMEHELEDMLEIIHEDGDGWTSVGKYCI